MPLPPLNLDLALTRVEQEFRYGRAFVMHPYELALVRSRRAEWLDALSKSLADGSYHPSTPFVTNVPKGDAGVRPGALLSLADQVVYTAAVGAALPVIGGVIAWSKPPKDYAYQIRRPEGVDWVSFPVWCWETFRARSLALLDESPAVVVTTDIALYPIS